MKQKSLFGGVKTSASSPRKGAKRAKVVHSKLSAIAKKQTTINESILALINRRQRQILLHSYIYYDLDKNIISDHVFDKWCFELVDLAKDNPYENKQSEFYNDFINFDGSTGMDLCYKQPFTIKWAEIFLSNKFKLNGGINNGSGNSR